MTFRADQPRGETGGCRVHRWGCFEAALEVPIASGDPLRDVRVNAEFTTPSGRTQRVPAFWDGGTTWRARVAPDEVGTWHFHLRGVVAAADQEAFEQHGSFECVPYEGDNPLYRHGPPRLSADRTHLIHADGTPFFLLGDTVWNGPMRAATDADWRQYVETRREQGFTAALFVSTAWHGLPDGGPEGPSHTWTGDHLNAVNMRFYKRLDRQLDQLVEAGIVGVPVLLWANGAGPDLNPGLALSDDDAILLARYQVARWHAYPVIFILNGDGQYTGERAERWHRIGRAAFADNVAGIPVALHPGGLQWPGPDFKDESWMDVLGYQSGHRGTDASWRWLVGTSEEGAVGPAQGWWATPGKIAMNLEPCYEDHNRMDLARTQGVFERFTAEDVRRALYWSLLISPTAGVVYGGHGVWGWDEGTEPPIAHPLTGTPRRWSDALRLPAAEQVRHLRAAFEALPWWTLRPDSALLREQPGHAEVRRTVTAARRADGSVAVVYSPTGGVVALDSARLNQGVRGEWVNPRDGSRQPAASADGSRYPTPDQGDWLLILRANDAH